MNVTPDPSVVQVMEPAPRLVPITEPGLFMVTPTENDNSNAPHSSVTPSLLGLALQPSGTW